MHIRIGLENNIEERTLAWTLDFPGCFAYGADEAEALIRLPQALLKYEIWIKGHTSDPWVDFNDLEMQVVERFETFRLGEDYLPAPPGAGYEINAWFIDDWRPLTQEEVMQGIKIFHWQRDELLAGLSTLDPDTLTRDRPGQRWNILGIARHIANAELWYLSRLHLNKLSREDLDDRIEVRLQQTSTEIDQTFPDFVDQVRVEGMDGEIWSYRKILRRTLWHQRDHIEHIKQLVFEKL